MFAGALFPYEDDEPQTELRSIMAYSASGKLYVVGDDGRIKAADVRQQLLSGAWAQGGAATADGAPPTPPPSVRTITTAPPLELTAAHFALNRSGTYAAVAGSALEDPEVCRLVIVDLTNCRPAPTNGGGGGGGSGRHDVCPAVALDGELFAGRPGLRVMQLAWHPDSDGHLAVLTSDSTWRLYSTRQAGLAEQTFELQLRGRRGLGLGAAPGDGRTVVAFAFGPPELWQRFTVYFLAADGSLSSLCPVVPFGCRYPSNLVAQLEEAAGGGGDRAPNTAAWLQRAFRQLGGQQDADTAPGMAQSVAHALDEHVPALAGPLAVACADGEAARSGGGGGPLMAVAGAGDAAQALLLSSFSPGCTAVAVATARGCVGLHLLAGGGGAPAWCEAAPQCVAEGADIVAVRSQVGVAAPGPQQPALLLLDVVDLSLPADGPTVAAAAADEDGWEDGAAASALLPDAAAPEVLYAVHCGGAHALTLTWLPLLAGLAAEGGGALPAVLPRPAAEPLLRAAPGAGVVAAAPVGDALAGSALVALTADGQPRCLRPHAANAAGGGGGAAAMPAGATSAAPAQRDVDAQLATVYGDLLAGPKPCPLPAAAAGRPAGAGNPEGQRLLNEAAAALRGGHVEYVHQAHQDLLGRIKQLQSEADGQAARLAGAEEAAAASARAAGALDARATRVLTFQKNLGERLRLLAELHWSLPRPASRAEQRFAAEQLPAWEAAAAALEEDARALRARVALLRRKLSGDGGDAAAALGSGAAAPALPPHQLRRVREALGEQEAQLGANLQRLAVLEQAAAAATGG